MGRPTDCTPEVTARVVDAITDGLSNEDAAMVSGISRTAFYEWIQRGEAGEEPFAYFADAITRAKTDRKHLHLRNIRTIAVAAEREGDRLRASTWYLEHVHRDEFGTQRHEVTGKDGGPIEVDARARLLDAAKQLTDAELGIDDGANK